MKVSHVVATDRYLYFSCKVNNVCKNAQLGSKGLIRTIFSRCEIDLENIKKEYKVFEIR